MFTWRTGCLLGRASPSKRAGFHLAFTWENPVLLLPELARFVETPGLTTFIFPRKPELLNSEFQTNFRGKQFTETDNPGRSITGKSLTTTTRASQRIRSHDLTKVTCAIK